LKINYKTIIGKTIIVGITYLSKDGVLLEQTQFFGTIEHADKKKGIAIKKANGGETFNLPPDIRSIRIAQPGEYKFWSTGEIIVNPDLLTTWTVNKST